MNIGLIGELEDAIDLEHTIAQDEALEATREYLEVLLKKVSVEVVRQHVKALDDVRKDGLALKSVPESLKGDRDIVLAAVKNNAKSLKYVNKEMDGYKDVALEAVKRNGFALEFASLEIREDKMIILNAIYLNGGYILRYVSPKMKEDKDVVLASVERNGYALQYADPKMYRDKDIILTVVLTFFNHSNFHNLWTLFEFLGQECRNTFNKLFSEEMFGVSCNSNEWDEYLSRDFQYSGSGYTISSDDNTLILMLKGLNGSAEERGAVEISAEALGLDPEPIYTNNNIILYYPIICTKMGQYSTLYHVNVAGEYTNLKYKITQCFVRTEDIDLHRVIYTLTNECANAIYDARVQYIQRVKEHAIREESRCLAVIYHSL